MAGRLAGLSQVFYREWNGALLANLDLLGVLAPYRRSGLALALVQQALRSAAEMASIYGMPLAGLATLIDCQYPPIVRLHEKLGGQIRRDDDYLGDRIVWYPAMPAYEQVETRQLEGQFRRFAEIISFT